jgi:hypothetical protein
MIIGILERLKKRENEEEDNETARMARILYFNIYFLKTS